MSDKVVRAVDKVVKAVAENAGLAGTPVGLVTAIFGENKTWAPVIPADMHTSKLPAVAADGTVECWQCQSRVLFANANIANQAYVCGRCTILTARHSAEPVDESMSLKSNAWIWKVLAAVAVVGITIGIMLWSRARSLDAERQRSSTTNLYYFTE